jgi:hypothetical protein
MYVDRTKQKKNKTKSWLVMPSPNKSSFHKVIFINQIKNKSTIENGKEYYSNEGCLRTQWCVGHTVAFSHW